MSGPTADGHDQRRASVGQQGCGLAQGTIAQEPTAVVGIDAKAEDSRKHQAPSDGDDAEKAGGTDEKNTDGFLDYFQVDSSKVLIVS